MLESLSFLIYRETIMVLPFHCTNIQFMERKEIQSFSIYW